MDALVLRSHIVETTMLESLTLPEVLGAQVWFKFENLESTGSSRGQGSLVKLREPD
jgi:threonine dehydratase